MVTLRAFLALAGGVAAAVALAATLTALLRRFVPDWTRADGRPEAGFAVVGAGTAFLSGAAGGFVTAWAAAANPLGHLLALGIAVLALAGLNALSSRGKAPIWVLLPPVALAPLGVLAGGLLQLQVAGIL